MHGLKHLFNPGPNVMFVAGMLIPPGEGRDVPAMYVPDERTEPEADTGAPAVAAVSLEVELAELLKKPVKEIATAFATLSNEALVVLAALESEAEMGGRKTLLAAVAAEQLRRADEGFQAEADALAAQQLAALTVPQQAAVAAVVGS